MEAKSDKNKKSTSNKNKDSKVDRPVKWSHNKHTFTVSGTEFCVEERYELIKQIGVGAYGVVVSCFDKKENRQVAVKKVVNAFEDLIDAKRIVREIKLLKF